MGAARRGRSNKENTFLESIKCTLDDLRHEVAEVKWLLNSKDTWHSGSSEDLLRPPPPPPELDVFNRDFLLQFRGANLDVNAESTGSNRLPKIVLLEDFVEQDEITEFLTAQGHYELDENIYELERRISEAQQQAAILRETCINHTPEDCSIVESVATAQRQAAINREAEKSGERLTSEAQARADDIAARSSDCDLPDVLDIDVIGRFVLAHVEIAMGEHRPEHRRPYLQQQYARIQSRIQITDELKDFLSNVLDRFAPDVHTDSGFRYMCSQCGARYRDAALRCLVCCGHDVFDAIETGAHAFAMRMIEGQNLDTCESSETSPASSDYASDDDDSPNLIGRACYPNFMRS